MADSAAVPALAGARLRSRQRVVAALFAIAAVGCALVVGTRAGLDIGRQPWAFRPWRLAGATAIELATLAWSVYVWSWILARFDGPQPGYRQLLRAWRASTLAKYLPGSVWAAASTVEMATRIGASLVGLPASFLLQAALNLVGAVTVAALFAGSAWWLAAAAIVGVLVLVHPRTINVTVRGAARLTRCVAPTWHGSWAAGAMLLVLSVMTWLAYGAAFALFLSALVPVADISWLRLAGMNALAFAAGFVAFFSPGGVGIREAALVALLGPVVAGTGARIGVAAASRLWLVLTEIAGAALVVAARPRVRARLMSRVVPPAGVGAVHRGIDVEWLTDTRAALGDITAACGAATRSIRIAQLAFDADCIACDASGTPHARTLLETIVAAARHPTPTGAPLDVRILLNGGLLLDTSPALRRALVALGAGANVQLRTVKAFPQVMHAKVLVVDDVDAFVTGASFVNGYWDDARVTSADASDAGYRAGDRPLHDAAIRIRGSAAASLGEWFDELWSETTTDHTTDDAPLPVSHTASAASLGTSTVQLLRTQPSSSSRPDGRTEILDAYLAAIDRARSCIYLESQYFSARPIARAVRAALDAHPQLECILVLNQNPDVTAYRGWQDARLIEHDLLAHPRVGAFALWGTAPSSRTPGRTEVTQVFVHSKAAVVDDAWATLGTANLDGASLHSYGDDFASPLARRAFGGCRNFDVNIAVLDGVDGAPHTGVAATLRRRLWARHLGLAEDALAERPADGWLPLWRARASAHVAEFTGGGWAAPFGRALPYVPVAHPRGQLTALGIDLGAAGLDLRFDPSWLEVHCSPGWMRKLLPERVRRWL